MKKQMQVLKSLGFSHRAAKALIEDADLRQVIEVQALISLKPPKAKSKKTVKRRGDCAGVA